MDKGKEEVGFHSLPQEVLDIIESYLPPTVKVWLNKNYYNQYKHCIKELIPRARFDNYVISSVRSDNSFVFQHIIEENKCKWFEDWINGKRYKYSGVKYDCFMYFVYEYSIQCNSNKCREIIEQHATELIGPKWHKKNKASSFRRRWSN